MRPCPIAAQQRRASRNFTGKGAEGCSKGQDFGKHGGSKSQHRNCPKWKRLGDDADNGGQKYGQQMPGLGSNSCISFFWSEQAWGGSDYWSDAKDRN